MEMSFNSPHGIAQTACKVHCENEQLPAWFLLRIATPCAVHDSNSFSAYNLKSAYSVKLPLSFIVTGPEIHAPFSTIERNIAHEIL